MTIPSNAVLLIIDVQKGFDLPSYWGNRNNPDAESNIEALLKFWRSTSRPVVHVRHMSTEPQSPLRGGQSGNEFKECVMPVAGEHVEEKTVNSAFIGTTLEKYLRDHNYDTVVITGLTTDHCVSTSTRMCANLGFNTYLVGDATATFERTGPDGTKYTADEMHSHALASLNREFASIISTRDILEKNR